MRLGVHVSIAGGLREALERARRLSCTAMQLFSRSPRGGSAPAFAEADLREFHEGRLAADIQPLAVHGPYIINLASPDPVTYGRSAAMYREEYARCMALRAQYLVTHVGSHMGQGEQAGIERVAEAINQAMGGRDGSVTVLLENTAGAGQGLGFSFEQLRAIRDRVQRREAVGICLDTAHLFAAGFAIHTEEGLERTIDAFRREVGLEQLRLVHLNDSKVAFDSRVDRHWDIGLGQIGLEAMGRIVNHPALRGVPMILETPKKTEEDDRRNLATVRGLLAGQAGGAREARRA